jgi:hypothetical protein
MLINNHILSLIYNFLSDSDKINLLYSNHDLLRYRINIYFNNWFNQLFSKYGNIYPDIKQEYMAIHPSVINYYIERLSPNILLMDKPIQRYEPKRILKVLDSKYPEFEKEFYRENISYIKINRIPNLQTSIIVNCNSKSKYYGLFINDLHDCLGSHELYFYSKTEESFDYLLSHKEKMLIEKKKNYTDKLKLPYNCYYYDQDYKASVLCD